jgi:hypothetical protein
MGDFDGGLDLSSNLMDARRHAFTSANEESDISLPAPPEWVIKTMSEGETGELLERHIDFVGGDGRSVHCPTPFVRHYVRRDDEVLPRIVALSALPIVTADGDLLAEDGLNRKRGIVFNIEPSLMMLIPKRKACDTQAIGDALQFLVEDWLADVATDVTGKRTLVSLALTIIERSLLDQRPAWFGGVPCAVAPCVAGPLAPSERDSRPPREAARRGRPAPRRSSGWRRAQPCRWWRPSRSR